MLSQCLELAIQSVLGPEQRLAWRKPEYSASICPSGNGYILQGCYCCSVTQSSPTLCNSMDCSMPGLPIPDCLPRFAHVHVHWYHAAISSSDTLFSFCPQSFPASGTFPLNWLFSSVDQNTGASPSASVLPMTIQGLFLLGLISLLSKGLSGVLSSTTVQRHQLFGTLPSLRFSSHNYQWPQGRP